MFKTPNIHINEHGIDLLENFQFVRHLDYSSISSIEIKYGSVVKNKSLTFLSGAIMIAYSFFLIYGILSNWTFSAIVNNGTWTSLRILFLIPIGLLLFGTYVCYLAFEKSFQIIIYSTDFKRVISLPEIKDDIEVENLKSFIKSRKQGTTKVALAQHHKNQSKSTARASELCALFLLDYTVY
jgi:hypothetical protein